MCVCVRLAGDAVVFYDLKPSGEVDKQTIHAGTPPVGLIRPPSPHTPSPRPSPASPPATQSRRRRCPRAFGRAPAAGLRARAPAREERPGVERRGPARTPGASSRPARLAAVATKATGPPLAGRLSAAVDRGVGVGGGVGVWLDGSTGGLTQGGGGRRLHLTRAGEMCDGRGEKWVATKWVHERR